MSATSGRSASVKLSISLPAEMAAWLDGEAARQMANRSAIIQRCLLALMEGDYRGHPMPYSPMRATR